MFVFSVPVSASALHCVTHSNRVSFLDNSTIRGAISLLFRCKSVKRLCGGVLACSPSHLRSALEV